MTQPTPFSLLYLGLLVAAVLFGCKPRSNSKNDEPAVPEGDLFSVDEIAIIDLPPTRTAVSPEKLAEVVTILRQQESAMKNLALEYTLRMRPSTTMLRKAGVAPSKASTQREEVKAIVSGVRRWERSRRFAAARLVSTEHYAWDGTQGQRMIRSEEKQKTFGWKEYDPKDRSGNPSSTDNILSGFLGTRERSLPDLVSKHAENLTSAPGTSHLYLTLSGTKDSKREVVLDNDHGYWPKQVTVSSLSGTNRVSTVVRFRTETVHGIKVFYPETLRVVRYGDPDNLDSQKVLPPGELAPITLEEVSIHSMLFPSDFKEGQFRLTFPEETVFR